MDVAERNAPNERFKAVRTPSWRERQAEREREREGEEGFCRELSMAKFERFRKEEEAKAAEDKLESEKGEVVS